MFVLAVAVGGCQTPQPAGEARVASSVSRSLGSWNGQGNTTLGFVSESGSFRINWTARNQKASEPGQFQLTLRSGISGRPIQVIADHLGPSGGSVEFGDDPRLYEFLVESTGMEWSISVEETLAR